MLHNVIYDVVYYAYKYLEAIENGEGEEYLDNFSDEEAKAIDDEAWNICERRGY